MKHVSLLTMALLLASAPSALAAELGDALQRTFEADQWNYTSTVQMNVESNAEMDIPFDFSMRVDEEGGKNGTRYSEMGNITSRFSNIESSEPWSDLSYVDVNGSYRADYEDATQTTYLLMDKLQIDTDSRSFQEVTGMLNEIAKLFTGKAFKMSSQELSQALMRQLPSLSSDDLMALNALHGQSVQKIMMAFTEALDGFIASGIFIDEVQASSPRRRTGTGLTETHVLRLASSITADQADRLRTTLMQFLRQVAPAIAEEAAREMQGVPANELAEQINQALAVLSQSNLQMTVDIGSGFVEMMEFNMDLKNLGVPLTASANMDFDYTRGYSSVVPKDEKNMIDLNKVINGFVSMVGITSSSFDPSGFDEISYGFSEDFDSSYYLALDTIDEIDSFLWNMCGDDRRCRRTQINSLRRDLQQLRREGRLTQEEYRWKLQELKSLQ
ncbi:MAG: hypothetical protein AB7J40_05610 [Candidatus Altimarinota bacterium]